MTTRARHRGSGGTTRRRGLARVVVGLGLALVLLPGCGRPVYHTAELSYQVADGVDRLVIDARAGEVHLRVGDGPVRVTETHRYTTHRADTTHTVTDTTLRLTAGGCGRGDLRCGVLFDITAPAATAVDISARGAGVDVVGLTGDITVRTDAGAVDASGLGSSHVSVRSKAGAISLGFTAPPTAVAAETDLGGIEIMVPAGTAYAVDAATAVGGSEVLVKRDPRSPHTISARTDLGGIRVDHA